MQHVQRKKINDILGFCSQNYEATLSLFLFIDFNTSIVGHFHYEQMLVNLCTVNLKHMKRLIPISGIYVGMFGRTDECYPNDTQYIQVLQHFRENDLTLYQGNIFITHHDFEEPAYSNFHKGDIMYVSAAVSLPA